MHKCIHLSKAAKRAALNDAFRQHTCVTMTTPGIMHGIVDLQGLMRQVASFKRFHLWNNSHRDHDFGALTWEGKKIFWKIDYYDPSRTRYCDPLSKDCHRVLTVMLASEY